jgi:DNA polymerase-1
MQWIGFTAAFEPKDVEILILSYDLQHEEMRKHYLENGLIQAGVPAKIAFSTTCAVRLPCHIIGPKQKRKALSAAESREFFSDLFEKLKHTKIKYVLIANPDYYKIFTGSVKAALEVGSLCAPDPNHFKDLGHLKVGYLPSHRQVFYDPLKTTQAINTTMKAVFADTQGAYKDPGTDIIHDAYYPQTADEILDVLSVLRTRRELTCDIEGFSLHIDDAGIASIAFAWNKHSGVAFQVDHAPGFPNLEIRRLLAAFFVAWKKDHDRGSNKRLIFHNAAYDISVLIHQLFKTETNRSYEELFDALAAEDMIHDTKIITYLATNSTAGNKLSLKEQAVEFAGNYAVEDIKDVTKIPVQELVEYNLVDCLSTWYVYEKNMPIMIAEGQEEIYREIFKPSLIDIIDMQINGLPIDMEQVAQSRAELEALIIPALQTIQTNQLVQDYTLHMKKLEVEKLHAKWKKKRTTFNEIQLEFNPGSDLQLAGILFDPLFFGFPILGKTDSGAPSTKASIIRALKNYTKDPDTLKFLDAVIEFKDVRILLTTFIPAMENARRDFDGHYYVHGNFNLGGTVSGRLSSSDPNLQNMPSGARLAKYIKKCVKAPEGYLFVGLDFDSLEDKISALTTKDPNKLKVYTDGYDGHSLRAYSYFGKNMPDIDPNSVAGINSIAKLYPKQRQDSKAPTFALTYGGTNHALVGQCGLSKKEALEIEAKYHELYIVSDRWVESKIEGARRDGYITVAFGLKVRTPLLYQTLNTERHTPYAAMSEARTAGNALGQSWGLLNNRAASAFMKKVRANKDVRPHIRICCQIHDAQYYLVKNTAWLLHWFNKELTQEVRWQAHPDIAYPDVKLSGSVSIFYPTWAKEYSIPNSATINEIQEIGKIIIEENP